MIKDLITSVLGSEGSSLMQGFDLPADTQEKALDLAKDSVLDGISDTVSSGNIGAITQAFSGGSSSSLIQSIIAQYGSSLISKLGISDSLANTISTTIIPMIFSFINKDDSAPTDNDAGVTDLLGDLIGGSSSGGDIGGALGGMLKDKFKF